MKIKKVLLVLLLAAAAFEIFQLSTESTAFTSLAANFIFKHNFHEVVPGRLYRSAAMSPEDLIGLMHEHKIASVIDLRRDADDNGLDERRAVESIGAKYFAAPMNSGRPLTHDKLKRFFSALDQAPEPLLVHCSSGTHRSGVASAIWLMTKKNVRADEAARQLSPRYGFFSWERKLKTWTSGYPTVDEIIWNFEKQPEHEPRQFRDWALNKRQELALH